MASFLVRSPSISCNKFFVVFKIQVLQFGGEVFVCDISVLWKLPLILVTVKGLVK